MYICVYDHGQPCSWPHALMKPQIIRIGHFRSRFDHIPPPSKGWLETCHAHTLAALICACVCVCVCVCALRRSMCNCVCGAGMVCVGDKIKRDHLLIPLSFNRANAIEWLPFTFSWLSNLWCLSNSAHNLHARNLLEVNYFHTGRWASAQTHTHTRAPTRTQSVHLKFTRSEIFLHRMVGLRPLLSVCQLAEQFLALAKRIEHAILSTHIRYHSMSMFLHRMMDLGPPLSGAYASWLSNSWHLPKELSTQFSVHTSGTTRCPCFYTGWWTWDRCWAPTSWLSKRWTSTWCWWGVWVCVCGCVCVWKSSKRWSST